MLWSIEGNRQWLDGGAMFGNVPRALWETWLPPDERHRVPLACRALLTEHGGRRILLEAGIGAFFEPRLRERFGVTEPRHVLLDNLRRRGLEDGDIDVVVLSHLHFDHAGGLLAAWEAGAPPRLLFPRARFVVSQGAWDRARRPHARDRASFIAELPALLEATGRLEVVAGTRSDVLGPDLRLHLSEGHTPGLLLTELPSPDGPVLFAGDLIPGRPWVHVPVTMGYDRFPERLLEEKEALLADLVARGGRLFFTHDPEVAMAEVRRTESGRFEVGRTWASVDGDAPARS